MVAYRGSLVRVIIASLGSLVSVKTANLNLLCNR